jgi:hypothetical protein
MSQQSIRERMARAMSDQDDGRLLASGVGPIPWETLVAQDREAYLDHADVALSVLGDATDAMVERAYHILLGQDLGSPDGRGWVRLALQVALELTGERSSDESEPLPDCSCAMTEASMWNCPIHGVESSEERLAAWDAAQASASSRSRPLHEGESER